MKFVNIEEKEEKLNALVFLKNQILRKAEKLEIKQIKNILQISNLYYFVSATFLKKSQ